MAWWEVLLAWFKGIVPTLKAMWPTVRDVCIGMGVKDYMDTKQEVKDAQTALDVEKKVNSIPSYNAANKLHASKYQRD